MLANTKLVIPEYKIELLNKSKKVINTIENIDKINEFKENSKANKKPYTLKDETKINLKKLKKTKTIKKKIKKPRTLWFRRKKIA